MGSPNMSLSNLAGNYCERCRKLLQSDIFRPQEKRLPTDRQDDSLMLTFSELKSSALTCETCHYFFKVTESEELLQSQILSAKESQLVIGPSQEPYALYRRPSHDGKILDYWLYRIDITLTNDTIAYPRRGTPSILPLASNESDLFHARQLSDFGDLDLTKKWLSICKSCHGASCESAIWKALPALPFRLVDVKQKCVVEAPVSCTYIALSYVWGHARRLLLQKDNQHLLTTEGSLIPSAQNYVPQVFLDAIRVSEVIGSQYIWIDAICIMQDDEDESRIQMDNMRYIYSCADLTIVCNSENVATGLPGLQSQRRTASQEIYRDGQLQLTTVLPNLHHSLSFTEWTKDTGMRSPQIISPWESRGWTFQEKLLSQRLLIFDRHQIFFQCNKATWSEDTILEVNDATEETQTFTDTTTTGHQDQPIPIISKEKMTLKQSTSDMTTQWLELYADLLQSYSVRSLTESSDAINAFHGALDSVSSSLGQHIYGLPQVVFHAAMLWDHDGISNRTNERKQFPSWSWAAWEGESAVSMRGAGKHDPNFGAQMYRWTPEGNFELVEASRRESLLYQAHRSSTKNNDLSQEQLQELKNAIGWRDQSDQFVEEQLRVFKKALSCTDWNPFEAPSITDLPYPRQRPPKAHILRFWTTSASLLVKQLSGIWYRAFHFPKGSSQDDISRLYSDNERCSYLFDTHPCVATVALDPSWRNGQGRGLEFIILSNYTNFKVTGPYQDPDASRLNAMLIEWRDDIAYRVGITVVKEGEWLLAKPKWKLVTLA